jgi:uncharacterized small protein (DUF1192 family)
MFRHSSEFHLPLTGLLVALAKQDLDPMSIEELIARVEALKVEIARVEGHMKRAQDHRSAAEELFKKS